ncbi:hypothetical protein ACFLYA_02875 [Candidatus Dependentiae bacterium]
MDKKYFLLFAVLIVTCTILSRRVNNIKKPNIEPVVPVAEKYDPLIVAIENCDVAMLEKLFEKGVSKERIEQALEYYKTRPKRRLKVLMRRIETWRPSPPTKLPSGEVIYPPTRKDLLEMFKQEREKCFAVYKLLISGLSVEPKKDDEQLKRAILGCDLEMTKKIVEAGISKEDLEAAIALAERSSDRAMRRYQLWMPGPPHKTPSGQIMYPPSKKELGARVGRCRRVHKFLVDASQEV